MNPSTMEGNTKWWTLGAVCVAIFMLLLDITVVNVAGTLPVATNFAAKP